MKPTFWYALAIYAVVGYLTYPIKVAWIVVWSFVKSLLGNKKPESEG